MPSFGKAFLPKLTTHENLTTTIHGVAAEYLAKTALATQLPVSSASGTYTGNAAANRAIAHGLGKIPAQIWIWNYTDMYAVYKNVVDSDRSYYLTQAAAWTRNACTATTTTNFYVNDLVDNTNLKSYLWVAIA